ncbi:MAG: lysophospholipid acyltransferase family protein [Vicingaceae bacterium]
MIYSFLKILMRLSLKVYFRKLHVKGLENIPKDGPFLIVANHPSSFLDPIAIATMVRPKINFLAKATIFNNKIAAKILQKINLVPIYRAQDNPEKVKENKAVFQACFDKLSSKAVIMIFPEGTSENERKLRPIKTGAARIALGTSKENDYNLNVRILPVGLNYTESSRFRSELSIEYGKPIETNDYIGQHKENEIKANKNLTAKIEDSIKQLIINIDNEECEELVQKLETIYKTELSQPNNLPITISQEIVAKVHYFQNEETSKYTKIKFTIDNYFEKLKEAKVLDKNIGQKANNQNIFTTAIKAILKAIIGFPIWLIGIIHSFLPYHLTKIIAIKISKDQAFYGALLMTVGTFLFITFYSFMIIIGWYIFKSPLITISHTLILPVIGIFTLYYSRQIRKIYYNWRFYTKVYNRNQLIKELILEREKIIRTLESIRD